VNGKPGPLEGVVGEAVGGVNGPWGACGALVGGFVTGGVNVCVDVVGGAVVVVAGGVVVVGGVKAVVVVTGAVVVEGAVVVDGVVVVGAVVVVAVVVVGAVVVVVVVAVVVVGGAAAHGRVCAGFVRPMPWLRSHSYPAFESLPPGI